MFSFIARLHLKTNADKTEMIVLHELSQKH